MSNRNLSKAIQGLSQEISKLCRSMTKQVINWLLRAAFVVHRPSSSSSGFVLPTTVLLILVVSLSVGALTYRAFTRNTQVITQNQQRVIYNAATPAIDRARSKLEFMFDPSKDIRYPSGGVPNETTLLNMMRNDSATAITTSNASGAAVNPYNLPDERRVKLDTSNATDNAWSFDTDMDGNGEIDATVVYSIIFQTPRAAEGNFADLQQVLVSKSDKEKAAQQFVRHGPLTTETGGACKVTNASGNKSAGDAGWFEDPSNTSIVRKNFQVDVLVIPHSQKSAAVTLEFQQDRQINKGNKWAAWFRNDLEVFPGPDFRWNGAMHTEGNLIVGGPENDKFQAYLISSTESCLYPPIENSEITITEVKDTKTGENFAGALAVGRIGVLQNSGSFLLHYQNGQTPAKISINAANSASTAANPSFVISDPKAILTRDRRQTKDTTSGTNNRQNVNWSQLPAAVTTSNRRLRQNQEPSPYIDDLYRADDRWGPKPKYNDKPEGLTPPPDTNAKTGFGYTIVEPASKALIVNENVVKNQKPTDKTDEGVGLDGYWERRARNEGLRVIVGERLELGNLFGWKMPHEVGTADNYIDPSTEEEGDPLYPPEVAPYPVRNGQFMTHVNRQHRTLRDNLSAVQATAIYHTDFSDTLKKDYPVACLASTAHPGTPMTLRNSVDFVPTRFLDKDKNQLSLMSDFFSGRGTNGWEFEPPQKTPDAFALSLVGNQPLRIALDNLAHLAGDPKGSFPPVQEVGVMHPYPALTMWGNFSNLRRALKGVNSVGDYDKLSIADKTYIQTASCTLGMMAYEIDMVQRFDLEQNGRVMQQLGADLEKLMNGDLDKSEEAGGVKVGGEVLPDSQIKSYKYVRGGSPDTGKDYEPRDYYDVPPEAYIAALRQKYTLSSGMNAVNEEKLRVAELIMLKYQIRRDRTFGFRPSPFFGHYVVTSGELQTDRARVFPTACDANDFKFDTADSATDLQSNSERAKWRLGLSRLCGALNIPKNYDLSKPLAVTAPRPVVMPKFPALYYLFPAQEHDLKGTQVSNYKVDTSGAGSNLEVPDLPNEFDTRQPTASLTPAARTDLLFTDDKFVEPYVSVAYNETAMGLYKFRPVQSGVSPALSSDASPYYNNDNTDPLLKLNPFDPAGLPPISGNPLVDPNNPPASAVVASFPDKNRSPFPIADTAVSRVAVQPRQLDGFPANVPGFNYEFWKLPAKTDVTGTSGSNQMNVPTNIIQVPTPKNRFDLAQKPYAVPFLDRAIFDGRQLMLTRVMDMDLGLMRSSSIGGQYNEPLLPMSGIVFAFREDAVREDAIARPADTSGDNRMSAIDPKNPVDPLIQVDAAQGLVGISTKAVDYLPDPERRVHGFRLRNGAQIKRTDSVVSSTRGFTSTDNYRGLSIFTDQPLYVQGDLNLHQTGADDIKGTALEEFRGPNAMIRGTAFNENQFYRRGTTGNGEKDPDFAQPDKDRWRPTELLADSISILSDNFCDGSASDLFVSYDKKDYEQGKQHPFPSENAAGETFDRGIYHDSASGFTKTGLYSVGCSTTGKDKSSSEKGLSSFRNSDQPFSLMPSVTDLGRFDWVRENSNLTSYSERLRIASEYDGSTAPAGDYMTPIKISRSGLPILRQPLRATPLPVCNSITETKQECNPVQSPRLYGDSGDALTKNLKFRPIGSGDSNRENYPTLGAATNVNSIVVSGIVPSQKGQSYGGLHNFPRFIEKWDNALLDYAGSFLQLSFSNYATAPWEMEGWEYDSSGTLTPSLNEGGEAIQFYSPPLRSWGYDVALQLAAAGPAASRFVVNTPSRNEFYSEPQVNDPYIQTLCRAAKTATIKIKGSDNLNCAS